MKHYDQFHDGWLDGLLIEDKTVRLFLSTEEKLPFTFLANGVLALSGSGFKAGNIIFDVISRQADELTHGEIVSVYGIEGVTAVDEAQKLLDRARDRNLIILEISPSYGASCMILAESIELLSGRESFDRSLESAIK